MKLRSISNQAVGREPAVANRSDTQNGRPRSAPAMFDTSAAAPAVFQGSVGAAERDNAPLRGVGLPGGAPRSPQPGTSTGGETHPVRARPDPSSPVAKRRRVDEVPAEVSGPLLVSAIISQAEAGLPAYQIANDLRLSEDTVLHVELLHLQSSLLVVDEQIRIERANLPPSPATPPPVSPEVVQAVIRELRGGVDRPDIARHLHLPEPEIQAIYGQLLDDEFAQLDMDAFKTMTGPSSGESLE